MELKIHKLIQQKRKKWESLQLLRERTQEQDERICCPQCKENQEKKKVRENLYLCPACGGYFPVTARKRIAMLADEKSFRELFSEITGKDPLGFPGYQEKLEGIREKTKMEDAFLAGTMRMEGKKTAIGVLDNRFLMGSMGTVVGEKIALLAEYAAKKKLPLILFSTSGGARMQEGLFSLMQMAKTCAAIERYKESGGVFLSCLTNPTTGGVSASYASLGDIILAEPKALICFAGPRVIEQTIGERLPEGFQRSEFLLEHGMLDMVVERKNLRSVLSSLIRLHEKTD